MKNLMSKASALAILAVPFAISSAQAAFTMYPNKAALLTAIHGDTINIGGFATGSLLGHSGLTYNGNGRTMILDSNVGAGPRLMSWSNGIGAPNPANTTHVGTPNRHATAFGCALRVANAANQSVGGVVRISTSGESFDVTVPPAGMYLAFTSSTQMIIIELNATNGTLVEMIDDVLLGDIAGRPATDQAVDAGRAAAGSNYFNTIYMTDDASGFFNTNGYNYGNSHDVWWTYTPGADGTLSLDTQTSDFDTLLAVYDSSGGLPYPGQLPIVMNDDYFGYQSFVQLPVISGRTYYIRVGGFAGNRGTGPLNLSFTATPECEADFNHDGSIDFFDYLDFVDAYSIGC